MDLNLAFDDEDFDFSRNKGTGGDHTVPYNVKLCTPEWFSTFVDPDTGQSSQTSVDSDQRHQVIKFSADLHYHRKQFSQAAVEYQAALDVVPENNVSVRQDIRESLCRCYANCGLAERSLELARELVREMSSEDEARQRQSLILLSSVCDKAGRWAECVDALERYCHLQPFFAQTWAKLADALVKADQEQADGVVVDAEEQKLSRVKALTCYVRAKFLCEISLGTASDLIKDRDRRFIEQMTRSIDSIPLSSGEKDFAGKFIPRDSESVLSQDCSKDGRPEGQADSNPQTSDSEIFLKRFCSWYEAYQNS